MVLYDGFSGNNWYYSLINNKAPADQIQKSFGLLDFLLSDEGLTLCRYGIDEVHYTELCNKVKIRFNYLRSKAFINLQLAE